jgi:hypothetical protein
LAAEGGGIALAGDEFLSQRYVLTGIPEGAFDFAVHPGGGSFSGAML